MGQLVGFKFCQRCETISESPTFEICIKCYSYLVNKVDINQNIPYSLTLLSSWDELPLCDGVIALLHQRDEVINKYKSQVGYLKLHEEYPDINKYITNSMIEFFKGYEKI